MYKTGLFVTTGKIDRQSLLEAAKIGLEKPYNFASVMKLLCSSVDVRTPVCFVSLILSLYTHTRIIHVLINSYKLNFTI